LPKARKTPGSLGREEKSPEKKRKNKPFLRRNSPVSKNSLRADVHTAKANKTELFSPQLTPKEPD